MDFITDPITQFLVTLGNFGLENTHARRFYSKYPAKVVSIEDPSKEGRVKVLVDITGHDKPLSLWAVPSAVFAGKDRGVYFPPEKDDCVWVWFDHGDPTQPHFSGGWWCNPERQTDGESRPATSEVPQEFKSEGAPTARGIKTKRGMIIFEDDDDVDPRIELATITPNSGAAATKRHVLVMSNKSGAEKIQVVTALGHFLLFDDQNKLIQMATPGKKILDLDDNNALARLKTTSTSIECNDSQQKILMQALSGGVDMQVLDLIVNATGKLEIMAALASTIQVTAGLTIAAGLAATITGATVSIIPATVVGGILLGAAAILRLVTETFLVLYNANVAIHNANAAVFNAHSHTFIGNLGAPGQTAPSAGFMGTATPAVPDAVTTQTVRAV